MPTLQITRAGLAPENLRATVEALQAVMFWPRDQDRREAFLRTCDAARRAELAEAVPGAFAPADLTTLICDALHVRAPAEWRDEMEQRLYRGTLVGIFFAECWNNRVRGKSVSVKQVYNLMTTDQWRMQHPEADISAKTLEAAIRDFRPAGPLWAATVIRFQVFKEVFPPNTPGGVVQFLATAEYVRQTAAATPLQGRNEPLLPAGTDVWRAPNWLQLPQLEAVLGP